MKPDLFRATLLAALALLAGCAVAPRRVAIMDFENATGSRAQDKLRTAIPEYLSQFLTGYEGIHVLERQDIHRFLADIDADPSDTRRLSRWQKLGEKIGAQYLIAGSCSRLDRNYVLAARVFSVEKGQDIPGSASTKTCLYESEIFDRVRLMAAELAYQLRYRTGGVPVPRAAPSQAAQPRSSSEQRLPSASERVPAPYLEKVR